MLDSVNERLRDNGGVDSHEVGGGEDELEPCGVLVMGPAGQVHHPGGFALADAVLDPGVLAVSLLEPGELAGDDAVGRVGDERCVPEPFGVIEQRQLVAGMRPFPADDHPGTGRPHSEVNEAGDLGHPGAIADPVGFDGDLPQGFGSLNDRLADRDGDGVEAELNVAGAAGGREPMGRPPRCRPASPPSASTSPSHAANPDRFRNQHPVTFFVPLRSCSAVSARAPRYD